MFYFGSTFKWVEARGGNIYNYFQFLLPLFPFDTDLLSRSCPSIDLSRLTCVDQKYRNGAGKNLKAKEVISDFWEDKGI